MPFIEPGYETPSLIAACRLSDVVGTAEAVEPAADEFGRDRLLVRRGNPDDEQIVVEEPTLLELEAPRLDGDRGNGSRVHLSASWATTGDVLPLPEPPTRLHLPFASTRLDAAAPNVFGERPLWQMVAILYGSVALLVVLVIGVTFLVAALVGGHAY